MEQERVEVIVTVRVPDRISRKDFMPYIAMCLRDHSFVYTDPEPLGFIFSRFTGPDWFVNVRGKLPQSRLVALCGDTVVSGVMSPDGTPLGGPDGEPEGVVLDSVRESDVSALWRVNALMLLHACCKPFVVITGLLPRRLRNSLRF